MSFSINVFDIQKKQHNKDKFRCYIFERILERCYLKIKGSSDNEHSYCFFQVPEYIPGEPLYNLTKCVVYILKHLRNNGFNCKYCHPFLIFISWQQQSDKYLLEDEKPSSNNINSISANNSSISLYKHKENNIPQTKNTSDYQSFNYLLYKKQD
jgi:hypothetical protein